MIKKFISIKNVGKLVKCQSAGNVEFRRLSLIFGENGRGKTTLCDILRSLQTGDPDYIGGRTTLGEPDSPEVDIRLEGDNASFKNGAWSARYPDLLIFDDTFVDENVYTGLQVDHEHKKNFCRLVIGKEGADLAREVDEIDKLIRELNTKVREEAAAVQSFIPSGITLDTFISLKADDDIDAKIEKQATEVKALERQREIKDKASLARFSLPSLPQNLPTLLSKTITDISSDAEKRVREHLHTHTGPDGETWVAQGLDFVRNATCPFCGQGLNRNRLLEAYRDYFSETYAELKAEIEDLERHVNDNLGDAALLPLQKTLNTNNGLYEFWTEFVSFEQPELLFQEVRSAVQTLRAAALAQIAQKKASPLEAVSLSVDFEKATSDYEDVSKATTKYNELVETANALIARKKHDTETGDVKEVKGSLALLQACKTRHQPDATAACVRYLKALNEKLDWEERKTAVKKALDEHSADIFPRYQERVNQLLAKFNAGFRIGNTQGQYK